MIQYLVMVNNTNLPLEVLYTDRYRVYNDFDTALQWATENGYYSMFPVNKAVGQLNVSKGGDIDVSIMAVEARDE